MKSARSTMRTLAVAVVGGIAVFGLASCADSGSGDEDIRVVKWAQPTPESMAYFPIIVAEENGYFDDEGIRVEVAPASEDLSTAALVSSGAADIAAASAGEIFFALQTDPTLTVVYDAASHSPEGIVVPADGDVEGIEDLKGATIGVASDEERATVAAALETVGATLDDVTLVTVGGGGQVIANELDGGQFDAFAGSVLDFAAVEAIGYELREITPETIAEAPSGAFLIGPDADEQATEGFVRAVARATAWGLDNPAELEEMLRERVPEEWENEDVARSLFDFGLTVWTPREGGEFGRLDPQIWDAAMQRLIAAGELTEELDITGLLDDRFVASANEAVER